MKRIIIGVIGIMIPFFIHSQVADSLTIRNTRYIDRKPSTYSRIAEFEFKLNSTIRLGSFTGCSGLLTVAPWSDDSGGPNHQLAFYWNGIYYRIGDKGISGGGIIDDSKNKWNSWNKLIVGDINGIIQNKLEVNGTIRSKEVKIEATGWSDFVFDENYKLPSLSEVENHIKENKHLPNIPSEKEVLKDGVNVVEMQGKLLQKIEELTLYMIDQDKQIKELRKQLEEQGDKK
ncbi:hypothetical protein [uncultured Dysgonomonas sp.]|uniref:hypothetical protein n=1 Tax=Dysgonomonas mossii TaxID=163665 RepID=UPI002805A435|nr:hypothetical protein [uncultured Dysgonomonas sp.]